MDFLRGYARWLISFLVVALSLFARSESRVQENGDGGPALAASINGPSGIVIDNEGNLYVVEQESSRVRRAGPARRASRSPTR